MSKGAVSVESLLYIAKSAAQAEDREDHEAVARSFFSGLCGAVSELCGLEAANQLAEAAGFEHLIDDHEEQ